MLMEIAHMLLSAASAAGLMAPSDIPSSTAKPLRSNDERHPIQDDFTLGRNDDPVRLEDRPARKASALGSLTLQAFARAGKRPKSTAI